MYDHLEMLVHAVKYLSLISANTTPPVSAALWSSWWNPLNTSSALTWFDGFSEAGAGTGGFAIRWPSP